jgi:ubiquitin C-terminal hydrolase
MQIRPSEQNTVKIEESKEKTFVKSKKVTEEKDDLLQSKLDDYFKMSMKDPIIEKEDSNSKGLSEEENKEMGWSCVGGKGKSLAVGILNIENSCYINSVLQCLRHTHPFYKYFINEKHIRHFNKKLQHPLTNFKLKRKITHIQNTGFNQLKDYDIAINLGDIMKFMSNPNSAKASLNPKQFKNIISQHNMDYEGKHQHDAQEFLSFLIDKLHSQLQMQSKAVM